MKTTLKNTRVLVMLLALLSTQAFGFTKSDKTIEKARAVIEKAAPDDWESYAKAADMCIRKGVNLTEAKEWVETSLTIKSSVLGNEVAGDYYMHNKLYERAIDHYLKGMLLAKEKDFHADVSELQKKIEQAKAKL